MTKFIFMGMNWVQVNIDYYTDAVQQHVTTFIEQISFIPVSSLQLSSPEAMNRGRSSVNTNMNEIQILLVWGAMQKPECGEHSNSLFFKKYFRKEVPFAF